MIKAKSVRVSQCEEYNLQRAVMWERGMERLHEKRKYFRERERRGEEKIKRQLKLTEKFGLKEKT